MNLYTLNSGFRKNEPIDEFSSVIWTERYSIPGDVTLEVDATSENITKLAEGTFLALSGTDEIMIIDNQSIENNRLTVTGSSLLEFLNQRVIYPVDLAQYTAKSWILDGFKPGELLGYIVDNRCITNPPSGPPDPPQEEITNLSLGAIDSSGTAINNVSIPFGQVLDALKPIAEAYSLGMRIYLHSTSDVTYSLKFTVYKGVDRSDTIRFSPELDSLTNIKELRSIKEYKTFVWVLATNEPDFSQALGEANAYPGADSEYGWGRRTLIVFVDDLTVASIAADPDAPTSDELNRFEIALQERGKNALAAHNRTQIVDGEVISRPGIKFGTDYFLGDIVALEGYTGIVQNARVTEYIRSQDSTGERAYPTVSLID